MKKYILYIFVCCFSLVGLCSGYEQQGFLQYQEGLDGISFKCENQCIIAIGQKDKIDYLNLDGTINGNGVIGYGFLMGDQVSLLYQKNIVLSSQINESMNFVEYKQYLSSLPGETKLILLVNGNVNGNLKIHSGIFSFGQKISQLWKDFWEIETYTPYSINLRYGVSLMGTSIVKCGYILFILASILILIFKKGTKEQKFKVIFYLGVGMFLFIGIRNMITYTSILNQGLEGFKDDKAYFDLGDYIEFTDKIRTKLNLDSREVRKHDCKIYINSFQDRPFLTHRENFYLKPCERVLTGDLSDYKIYYKTSIPVEDLNKNVLINFNNSYLLENNSK